MKCLAVLAAVLLMGAAAPPALPTGVFELVAVRASSDVASTIDSMRPAESLTALIGKRTEMGKFGPWIDGGPCAAAGAHADDTPWGSLEDPILSDLQLKPGAADRRLNRPVVVDCGARPASSIHHLLQVDGRVMVERTRNGAAYLILETPVGPVTGRRVEAGLKAAGYDPGPVDGVIDAATRRALGQYVRKAGAAYAFDRGVLTENLVEALTR